MSAVLDDVRTAQIRALEARITRMNPPEPEQDARYEALRNLTIWGDRLPDVMHDALGDMPSVLGLLITRTVADRIKNQLPGDEADIGKRVLEYVEEYVMNDARARS